MDQLKFVVLDEEDLEVASTHLQDAVVRVSDILWRPQEKRVVVALNRFDWEGSARRQSRIPAAASCLAVRARSGVQMPPGRSRAQR